MFINVYLNVYVYFLHTLHYTCAHLIERRAWSASEALEAPGPASRAFGRHDRDLRRRPERL